ncbi:isoflavone reductase family protein-like protein [Bisporella sp. PMI_857]|nr:isoflavone reductase family protein-like protein [Bisporella sp. PMI_857]
MTRSFNIQAQSLVEILIGLPIQTQLHRTLHREDRVVAWILQDLLIAGSGGLARILAYHLNETAHPFIILSRSDQPDLTNLYGYQCLVVDYNNQSDLQSYLKGVDLVISTVSGTPQINLIDAAANANVRRFVPAEFEGPPARRNRHDPLDRGKSAALERLCYWTNQHRCIMRFTIFTCGIFLERFAPGGLASINIGNSTGANYQGAYLMDIGNSTAEIVERNSSERQIYISMISVNDAMRFVAAAVELDPQTWPRELRMSTERRTISEILQWAEDVKGGAKFSTNIIEVRDLQLHLEQAIYYQDVYSANRVHELMATEQARYDFERPNLNGLVTITPPPESFWDWLRSQRCRDLRSR